MNDRFIIVRKKEILETKNWLPKDKSPLRVALTSGASCPDVLVDEVMLRVLEFFDGVKEVDEVIEPFDKKLSAES